MAKTSFSTSNALTKKAWEEQLFRDMDKESYFSKFSGTTSESIVQVKTQLEKDKGDKITFGLVPRLTGAGVTSGTTLEGKEERLNDYSDSVTLEQYRNGIRDDGALSRQRAMFEIDNESKMRIKQWGTDKIDALHFTALLDRTPTHVAYLTSATAYDIETTAATAKAALTTSSKLVPNFLSFVKTAVTTGLNRSIIPVRPVKIKGRSYLVLLVHPDVMYDLKTNSAYQQYLREAEVRGSENPIFSGAVAIIDGVAIHEHENCSIGTDAGAGGNVPWAKCELLGAQSLVTAWGKRPSVISENFDYENEHGYAIDMTLGIKKPQFNSVDYGSMAVYVARTQVSDS